MSHHLVVGMNGHIGSALFDRLVAQGIPTLGTTHRSANKNALQINLADTPANWQLPSTPITVAYLCAGICRMALCEEDPLATQQVNLTGMGDLVRRLADQGTFIIYLSTNQVFSGNQPQEKTTANYQPMNEYGRQKVAMETFIQSITQHFAIVRLTKVVPPNLALIKTWIDQLTAEQPIQTFHDMPLAPVSLRQVLDVLIRIGQTQQSGHYHISGAKDVSYTELTQYLAQCLGRSPLLIKSISAIDAGIKKIFLPRFTSLDCSSTIAIGGELPPHFSTVLHECFDLPK